MYNILVCDDDKEIVKAIDIYLSKENYKIFKQIFKHRLLIIFVFTFL